MIEIWLNPACSKCRTAVNELDAAGTHYKVRRYLDDPPTVADLEDVLTRLDVEPWHIARTGDATRLGVTLPPKDRDHHDEWLALMAQEPGLIQRPIITATDGTTVVARDAESLQQVIDAG